MLDIHISLTGRIAYDPRFFPPDHEAPAMWSAVLEVNGPPTPRRDGSTHIPTRQVEVVVYGVAAIRAHESYRKGQLIMAQGCDLIPRTYETKGREGKPTVRAAVKVIAANLGLASRYSPVHEGTAGWPVDASPRRLAQGASAVVAEEPATTSFAG
ncbi:single-stranded DNA-binding protein [Sphaerimonospora cavernae]|uniref:Single-stranded DNA-binding protein n=1 Tax=Sphaerimonospora cavernae TaxID=1740611 RepID=A0ABV6TX50_9ACTN